MLLTCEFFCFALHCNMLQVMMMELLHTRLEQETMHRELTTALALIRELPSALSRKDDGTAFAWGPDGCDLFEQAHETFPAYLRPPTC